jgi:hypothetical protein
MEDAMNDTDPANAARHIDLTDGTDVQYWCRIFDVTMAELRDAVHHAGHQADAVARYLEQKKGSGGKA